MAASPSVVASANELVCPVDVTASTMHFWFDFISPFGYLASLRINDLAARHGRQVQWHPILLGVTVLRVMGLKPIPQTPLKGEYALRELQRYQRRHGQVIGRDLALPAMSPLPAGRAFAALLQLAPDRAQAFAQAVLAAYWQEGREMDTLSALQEAGCRAEVPAPWLEQALHEPRAPGWLRAEVDQAVSLGVFGSPFFLVDGELFFGVDKLELLDEWLTCGGW